MKYIVTGIILGALIIAAFEFWPLLEGSDEVVDEPTTAQDAVPEQTLPEFSEQPAPTPEQPEADQDDVATSEEVLVEPAEDAEPATQSEAAILPDIKESDAWLDMQLEAAGFELLDLPREDRIARISAGLAAAADGVLIRKDWPALARFPVVKLDDQIWLDPAGYDRYEAWIERLETISPEGLAELVFTIRPWLELGLQQLGDRRSVDELLRSFGSEVESAPVTTARIELVQPNVLYRFKDPRWEQLNDVHKQMLRMGPDNTVRIQAYVDAFIRAYDLKLLR